MERALADGVGALKSEDTQGAAAVVIDVNDGGVLASASYPTYDLSTFLQNYTELANDPLNPLFNRGVTIVITALTAIAVFEQITAGPLFILSAHRRVKS